MNAPRSLADESYDRELIARDAECPLAPFRERLVIDPDGPIYLDGNSLGRPPRETVSRLANLAREEWGQGLIGGWNRGWWSLPERIGDAIGRLLGAAPGETIVADSTTVCLHKLLGAVVAAAERPGDVLIESGNFPSDAHAARAVAERFSRGLITAIVDAPSAAKEIAGVPESLRDALARRPVAAVLSLVSYRSGYRFDMAAVERAAAAAGTALVWDLSHAAGAVPIDLGAAGARFAIGCTYKYLLGGPGAPAFLHVRRDQLSRLENPIPGWVGDRDPFAMEHRHRPADSIRKFLTGTPAVLSLAAIEPGVSLLAEAGIGRIAEVGFEKLAWLRRQLEPLARFGIEVATPSHRHGLHLALRHPHAWPITQALIAAAVIPDFRPPDLIRFAVTPIDTRYADLKVALQRLEDILERETWRHYPETRLAAVT
jgi:kynureninase